MTRDKVVTRFQRMDIDEIRSQPVGKWSDMDLVDVLEALADAERVEDTWARERAVRTLVLGSPEHSEMVDYDLIFFELVSSLAFAKESEAAIATAYAGLVYCLQHDERSSAKNWLIEIAELFVTGSDISVGIAQFARLLRGEPTELHTYYRLIHSLIKAELIGLAKEALAAAAPLLTEEPDESDVESLKRQQAELQGLDEDDDLGAIAPQALADLRVAFALTHAGQADEKEYLPPLRQLLTAQAADIPALYTTILDQGEVLVPELLYLAWDDSLYGADNPAPAHALEILRSLRDEYPAHFSEIGRWLEQAKGDWRANLYDDFGLIGGYTPAELRQWATNAACDWNVRSSANEALLQRAEKHPDERTEIVAFLTELLNRPGAEANMDEETFTATVIGDLCDLGAQDAYLAIEAAFEQDRVDLQMIDLDYVREKLGLPRTTPPPRKDGLYLNLTCKRCGRVRPHFVQHVTLDVGTQRRQSEGRMTRYDPYVMDREIVCPKCGAKESYQLRGFDAMRLMIPLYGVESFRAVIEEETDRPLFRPHPRLTRFESVVFGRPMHPLEGLAEYRRRIQQDPTNADLRLRMGLMFRILHRFEECLALMSQAYELRPNDPKVMTFRAFFEHDFGDKTLAEELYRRAIPILQREMFRSEQMFDLAGMAADGLAALAQGEPSPWQPETERSDEDSSPAPERRVAQSGRKKKGKIKKKRRR